VRRKITEFCYEIDVNLFPTTDQIASSLVKVFSTASAVAGNATLGALVPHQKIPTRMISLVPEYEMEELCKFVNQFRSYIKLQPTQMVETSRCKVLIYCHIMEAEFPATVIWNLLRLIQGDSPLWTFSDFPGDRYQKIRELSEMCKLSIGSILSNLWCNKLRNAFSHAQYLLHEDGCFLGTRNISPVTAESLKSSDLPQSGGENPYFFRPNEIDAFFEGALSYLKVFIENYHSSCEPFKNGNWYNIPTGPIRWEDERGWWSTT